MNNRWQLAQQERAFRGKGTSRSKAKQGEYGVSGERQVFECVHTWQWGKMRQENHIGPDQKRIPMHAKDIPKTDS